MRITVRNATDSPLPITDNGTTVAGGEWASVEQNNLTRVYLDRGWFQQYDGEQYDGMTGDAREAWQATQDANADDPDDAKQESTKKAHPKERRGETSKTKSHASESTTTPGNDQDNNKEGE